MAKPRTKYNKKLYYKAIEYLEACEDRYEAIMPIKGSISITKFKVELPSIEGLARHLKITRETLYKYSREHDDFKLLLEQIRTQQAKQLINKGLSGEYNAVIAKLLLSKHGYHDKLESEVNQKTESIFSKEQLKLAAKELLKEEPKKKPEQVKEPETKVLVIG